MATTQTAVASDPLVIAGRTFRSRLIVGTGKYRSHDEMVRAHEASGAEDRKSTRLNSSHIQKSRMPSSA